MIPFDNINDDDDSGFVDSTTTSFLEAQAVIREMSSSPERESPYHESDEEDDEDDEDDEDNVLIIVSRVAVIHAHLGLQERSVNDDDNV